MTIGGEHHRYTRIGVADRLIAGRADAVRYRNGDAEMVFDWKSDVDPKADDRTTYAHQLAQYVHVLRAKRGAIVYMTTGEIQWVEPARASRCRACGAGDVLN